MAQKAEGGITPRELLVSIGSLAAVQGIKPETRHAIKELQGVDVDADKDGKAPLQGKGNESRGMREDRDALERMMDGER